MSHLHRFVKELLRERRLTVGRLEGRWTGVETDAAGETFEHDPTIPTNIKLSLETPS